MNIKKTAGLGVFLAAIFSVSAGAQESADSNEGQKAIEEITVTGSRIARKDLSSVGPITIIGAPEIAATGITSLEVLLQTLPSSAGFGGNRTAAYWVPNGWATAQINLRGMGINRTLVLLNGRRVVSGGTGANFSVDLNMIPISIVERIEVLKDGASAVYGADAVAGVVNIITKQEFEGVEASIKLGAAFEGDAEELLLDLTWGVTNDRGSLMASLSYQNLEDVFMSDRTGCGLTERGGELVCGGSNTTVGGNATLPDGSQINFNNDPALSPSDFFEPYDPAVHNFNSESTFNAVNPLERVSFSTFGNYQMTDNIRLFGELMFNNRQTNQPGDPSRLRSFGVAATNPFNPTGEDVFFTGRRIAERTQERCGQPTTCRFFSQNVDMWRFVAGLSGQFFDRWNWDVSYNWGRNTGVERFAEVVNLQRFAEMLDTAVCGANGIPCIDIFGAGDATNEAIDYMMFEPTGTGGNEQISASANISGELFDMPAGTAMIAAGVETREDKGWRDPDTIVALGLSNNNVAQPIRGAVEADEFYLELSLPLLTDVPLAQSLDLDLAWRYSDYETFGSSDNFKVGVNWQIFTDLKVRSTVSTAFRVPNVNELFGGIRTGQLNTIDPCSNWGLLDPSDVVSQNCQAVGLPADYVYANQTISTTGGGNPLLEPEEADTLTVGIVYQPSFLEGLALTLDYWDIEIEDAITTIDGTTTLALCYGSPGLSHPFCSPDTHTRNALIGDVDFLFAGRANTGLESINGIDFGLTYAFEAMDIPFTFQTKITFLDEYTVTPFVGAAPIPRDTTIGCCIGGYPEYRSYTSLKFGGNRWTGNYSIQTIGEAFGRSGNCPAAIGCNVDTVVYHNIQGSYEISENMDLAVGIDNLFDENPPYVVNWSDANTDTMTYDLIGVRGYARLTYRWQ